jgi:hypothetical protein
MVYFIEDVGVVASQLKFQNRWHFKSRWILDVSDLQAWQTCRCLFAEYTVSDCTVVEMVIFCWLADGLKGSAAKHG